MKKFRCIIPETSKDVIELLNDLDFDFLNLAFALNNCVVDHGVREWLISGKGWNTENYLPNPLENFIIRRFNLVCGKIEDPEDKSYFDHDMTFSLQPYPYIPSYIDPFIRVVVKAMKEVRKESPTFIDAGCGIGDKIKLANWLGCKAYGVEYSKFLINIATQIHRRIADDIFLGDITTFDFSPYDIIYAYNPMQSREGMYAFFNNVHKTAKNGTICAFINVGSGHEAMRKVGDKFTFVSTGIYKVNKPC